MDLLTQALRAANQAVAAPPHGLALLPPPHALVLGGGGALGSAVLAQWLVQGRAASVTAVVAAPLKSSVRGLQALSLEVLQRQPLPGEPVFDLALLVLERERQANGRDDALFRPDASAWLPLCRLLQARGVKRLVLLLPHAPAMLPTALRHGLANDDEAALVGLGFEQLLIIRAALAGERGAAPPASLAQRLANAWWQQLRFMVPQREQPLTTAALARCVVKLARRLPLAPMGSTRVLAPDVLWLAQQAAAATAGGGRAVARTEAEPDSRIDPFDAWADTFFAGVAPQPGAQNRPT